MLLRLIALAAIGLGIFLVGKTTTPEQAKEMNAYLATTAHFEPAPPSAPVSPGLRFIFGCKTFSTAAAANADTSCHIDAQPISSSMQECVNAINDGMRTGSIKFGRGASVTCSELRDF